MTNNNFLLTLFGATGDLASRKLYPGLYRLYKLGHIGEHFAVIGLGRRVWTKDHYEQVILDSIEHLIDDEAHAQEFARRFYYNPLDMTADEDYKALRNLSLELDKKYSLEGNRLFYLSVAPHFFTEVTHHIQAQNLLTDGDFNRLIIEKPFGHDFESAQVLQNALNQAFDENQIYRIDHYLGKEIVQSIENLRFDNQLMAHAWNKESIANIQITLAEAVDVEGRGEFYDGTGASKDMLQNHMMQLLALIAMEQPEEFTADKVRERKIEVLESLQLYADVKDLQANVVRGQYTTSHDKDLIGYHKDDSVADDSCTETYVALRLHLNLPQWKGVPFYLRTGKALTRKLTVIDVEFKPTRPGVPANHLRIEIDPDLGYTFWLNTKKVGFSTEPEVVSFNHTLSDEERAISPDDYERLILEVIHGDASRFAHWQEVAHSWKFVDRIQELWQETKGKDICFYPAKSDGPKEADQLIAQDGFQWKPIAKQSST